MNSPIAPARRIRSFVLRQGRITLAQNGALEKLWPVYGLTPEQPFEPRLAFGREAPLILEIGFGNGESLARMAAASPEKNFLGIEVHRPGVGHLLIKIEELGLENVRIYCADAMEILQTRIANGSLAGMQVFFPDPWHKKRHHKRRLVNAEFIRLVSDKLAPGGILHCATDWEDYARQMLEVMAGCERLRNRAGGNRYCERPKQRPLTKFEQRGCRLGHGVWDLLFERL
ncbi:MAG: tRNA (guanosine(46)-N7)-methyltransferase TrmB [Methylococcaceae bacterium]|nr:tRNA (guanosine(46)-N7)-methyltransferase TrmB [Methylococcaceae bacterium]